MEAAQEPTAADTDMPAKLSPKPAGKTTKTQREGVLTAQQELFIDALFARNFHFKDAAIQAGVAEKNASRQAQYWLDYPQVQAEIARRREKVRNTKEVDANRIVQELARIGLFNPKSLLRPDGKGMLDLKDMPDDIAAVISNITVTFGEEQDDSGDFHRLKHISYRFHDKLTALSQLSNILGLSQGGATTIINQTNTLNQVVVDFNALYKKQASFGEIPAHSDPAEEAIAALEAKAHSLGTAPDTSSPGKNLQGKLNEVESND